MCEYFALCERYPNGMVKNPMVGRVPACTRCAEYMKQELLPFTQEESESVVIWLERFDSDTFQACWAKAEQEMGEISWEDFDERRPSVREWMAHIIRNDNAEMLA